MEKTVRVLFLGAVTVIIALLLGTPSSSRGPRTTVFGQPSLPVIAW